MSRINQNLTLKLLQEIYGAKGKKCGKRGVSDDARAPRGLAKSADPSFSFKASERQHKPVLIPTKGVD